MIVYVLALHFAYKVLLVSPLGVYLLPLAYFIAPVAVSAYPHVYPVFVIVGKVTAVFVQFAVNVTVPLFVAVRFLKYVFFVDVPVYAVVMALLAVPVFAVFVFNPLTVQPLNV